MTHKSHYRTSQRPGCLLGYEGDYGLDRSLPAPTKPVQTFGCLVRDIGARWPGSRHILGKFSESTTRPQRPNSRMLPAKTHP